MLDSQQPVFLVEDECFLATPPLRHDGRENGAEERKKKAEEVKMTGPTVLVFYGPWRSTWRVAGHMPYIAVTQRTEW